MDCKNQLNGIYWCCFKLKHLTGEFILYFSFICCRTFAPPALYWEQRRKYQTKVISLISLNPCRREKWRKEPKETSPQEISNSVWMSVDVQNASQSLSWEDLAFLNQRETRNCLAFRSQLQLFPLGTSYSPSPSVFLMAFVLLWWCVSWSGSCLLCILHNARNAAGIR